MPERSQRSIATTSRTRSSVKGSFLAQEIAACASVYALAALAVRSAPDTGAIMPAQGGGGFILYFFAAFAAATLLLVVLLKTLKGARFFSILFALAVFSGVATLSDSLFGDGPAILITAAAVLLYYAVPRVIVFDGILALGLAGISANLGSGFQPTALVIILAILAVYDIVAVYATKHMVAMAEGLVQRKVFFAIILSETPGGYLARTADVTPSKGYLFLGTGDIALPALLVASAARIGVVPAAMVALGALAGLVAMQLIFSAQPQRRPMPALPPIALGAILGYLITFLLP